jgi:hypothetical protein
MQSRKEKGWIEGGTDRDEVFAHYKGKNGVGSA